MVVKIKLNLLKFTNLSEVKSHIERVMSLYLQVSSNDNICKQFGAKSGRTRGWAWPQGYKTFSILSSAEHEVYPAPKC